MDSYSGGSLQSSSGGDDDHDSRATTVSSSSSSFISPSLTQVNHPILNQPPLPPPLFLGETLPGYGFPNQNPAALVNLDMLILPPKSLTASSDSLHALPSRQIQQALIPSPPPQVPLLRPSSSGLQTGGGLVRSSKKRSRASRRAPTTVLTTDTSNFRAMVQEFTGIPPPPPSFITNSLPSYYNNNVFRPFAHKILTPHPFLATNFQIMNNHHVGTNSELEQMINLYSSPPNTSSNSTTILTSRPASTDQQFGLDAHTHLVASSRRNETSANDFSNWDGHGDGDGLRLNQVHGQDQDQDKNRTHES